MKKMKKLFDNKKFNFLNHIFILFQCYIRNNIFLNKLQRRKLWQWPNMFLTHTFVMNSDSLIINVQYYMLMVK